ncbi:MAG TPA: xanthine dehydrogenase family protein subunit M [Bacillales bacterium]|nr:xanthine dehydrogenase family protein subunit M [Bacillales bacterium]
MITSAFDYARAESVEDAVQLLVESGGEAKLLAGGHSLLPLMKIRLTTLDKLIDIGQIDELKGVRKEGDRLVVGALTTHKEISRDPVVKRELPLLAEAASQIGDIQVRNRGTIGGNLAHADPASDLPAVAMAFDARFEMQGPNGKESLGVDEFFFGPLITALPENTVLTSISFSIPPEGVKSTYLKYPHPASGYAVIGVAAGIGKASDGTVNFARIGITGVGDVAFRAEATEQMLISQRLTAELIDEAAGKADEGQEMGSDLFASDHYRQNLCKVYTSRALKKLLADE